MASERDGVIRLDKFDGDGKQLVAGAQQLADEKQHAEILPIHVLARGLEQNAGMAAVFKHAGAEPGEVVELCDSVLKRLPKASGMAYVSPQLLDLIERAERDARRDRADIVTVGNLLNALAQSRRGGPVSDVLSHFGIAPGGFRDHLKALDSVPKGLSSAGGGGGVHGSFTRDLVAEARADRFDPVIGRDLEIRRLMQILERRFKNHPLVIGEPGVGKTSILRGFAVRLAKGDVPSNLAGARLLELNTGALVAGAKLRGEIELRLKSVIDKLESMTDAPNILVVEELHSLFGRGVAGSGIGDLLKPLLTRSEIRFIATTTPEGIQKITERDAEVLRRFAGFEVEAPTAEQTQEILRGIASRYERHHRVGITEGAVRAAVSLGKRYLGDRQLPESAVDLIDESAARKRVAIDGMPPDVDAALRRLESLEAQIAGIAGDDDKLGVQMRAELEAEAEPLRPRVAEMRLKLASRRGVVAAVATLRKELAAAEKAKAEAQALKKFAEMGELEHVTIPDLVKRLEAAERAASNAGVEETADVLRDEDVAQTVNDWTGIPVAKMLEGEAEKLLKMEERLGQSVIGQDEAVAAIARAVRRSRVGLRDPGKPIGSFLFLGPSGVGKTYLAKCLAGFLFDDEQAITRFDMSEFMEKHMAQRLIGAPPGYADSEAGGHLTEAARRRPYSVLLFDEVEKAHADVFNLLLQVLDDGRLTDGRGRLANFSNTVVIMTSNIGSGRILEADPKLFESEDGREAISDVLLNELGDFFRPEFLNRIDDSVVFKPLTKDDLLGIVGLQLRKLGKMLAEREMTLDVTEAARKRIVDLGYEPALGARPVSRVILREIQNPLAQSILEGGDLSSGTIKIDLSGEAFTFEKA